MTKFKSLAVTAAALLATLSFAACSGGDEETPTVAPTSTTVATAAPTSTSAPQVTATSAVATSTPSATATPVPSATTAPGTTATSISPTATQPAAATATVPASTATPAPTQVPAASIKINLKQQNNSGQTGTATLTAKGNQTEIVLDLTPGIAGPTVEQPVHVHAGTCSQLGAVVYGLSNLVNGKSTTLVNATLDTLKNGNYAINAHKSGAESTIYTSCAEIWESVTIPLKAQNNSGQTGTATLYKVGNQTEVVVNITPSILGATVEQPVHIHNGNCTSLGSVVYGLTNVVNGKSTTRVNVTVDTLISGTFAVNVHKSGAEASIYTSCGEVKQSVTINLSPQNSSGQSGIAILTPNGNQTEVVMQLSTGPAGPTIEQPVHIHTGTCANLGGVVYGLTNLVNGKSVSIVSVSLSTLLNGTFAINAHKSGAEVSAYTSCGQVSGTVTSSASVPPSGTPAPPVYEY